VPLVLIHELEDLLGFPNGQGAPAPHAFDKAALSRGSLPERRWLHPCFGEELLDPCKHLSVIDHGAEANDF